MKLPDGIEIDEKICNGKPVITGTRIAVQSIIELFAVGETVASIQKAYPVLTEDMIISCLRFASTMMAHQYSVVQISA